MKLHGTATHLEATPQLLRIPSSLVYYNNSVAYLAYTNSRSYGVYIQPQCNRVRHLTLHDCVFEPISS